MRKSGGQPALVMRARRPLALKASIASRHPNQHRVTVGAYQRRARLRKFVREADLLKEMSSAVGDEIRQATPKKWPRMSS
jgi:hypothetical protein